MLICGLLVAGSDPLGLAGCVELLDGLLWKA